MTNYQLPMTNNYEVKLEQFSGPLEKLLELIEGKKLEITAISLAEVTEDFLDYLKTLSEEARHPSVLADFVVVASRLLLIKSKTILPSLELTAEEEIDIRDLETRLKIYQEFSARSKSATGEKNASFELAALWRKNQSSFSRLFLMSMPTVFYPPKNLKTGDLEKTMRLILHQLQGLLPEKQTVKRVVVSIEEKIKELMKRLKEGVEQNFQALAQNKPKLEIIVMFLAILHLLRERLIRTEQTSQFSDIIIKK